MKKQSILYATLLMLLSIVAAPRLTHPANAQIVGVVCVAPQGTTTSGCPASPQHFGNPGLPIGTHLVVAINIAGSDALNGFRVFVHADNTILNPISADLSNSLLSTLGTVLTLSNCVNGAGTGCSLSGGDGPGVVDVGAVELGPLSTPPTTGGLFEITYNVLSSTGHTDITILSQAITNGGTTTDTETVQAGDYGPVEHLVFSTVPPASVNAPIGVLTTITAVAADSDTNALTLTATGLPAGAILTTSGTNPVTGIISYTPANGPVSASVMWTATDTVDHLTVSATTAITVPPPDVRFFGGKLSWTHHLSLAKNANMQTWSAKVSNPGTETAYAVVTIQGTNGVTTFTATSAVLTLPAGAAIVATITQVFGSTDVGTKYHFTATIMWGVSPTALINAGGNSKSGAFAVVS